ncbi:MAG TPA: UDP-N-acetylglucosamine 1-carboxyvinyltransferase [Oligoflexia bacterium]|nr:UDP-N-acetylglucosamine 1-carboxyvinyltransferase [Oligoflexia bacterium]HMP47035.1 UDP-N-acetylglucosamine 1-carboxyvinyltransferase [Oligoflexia bacterium]
MDVLCISGPSKPLSGRVVVSGAKNASLPLLFASLLTGEPCVFDNVPDLEDTNATLRILRSFGARYEYRDNQVKIHTEKLVSTTAPYGLVKAMRASFWLMGPLLARAGRASVSLPGGDAIGTRPVDLHLKGLSAFGAEFRMDHGVVHAEAPGGLRPAEINLDFPSVGATHNILMAASLIPGRSVLRGAAREPEIVDVCAFLESLGAEISGAGTDEISIVGTDRPGSGYHRVVGDRIEAATMLLAAAVTAGEIQLEGISASILDSTLLLLRQMGCEIIISESGDVINLKAPMELKSISFETAPYPGVATDVQAIFLAALTRAAGVSVIKENIFESRFGHVAEYRRFGADIQISGRQAEVVGVPNLSGAPVEAHDIRAAAGLVIMGLLAEGTTQIRELHHLDRGYERMAEKLKSLGADIVRVPAIDAREVVVGC